MGERRYEWTDPETGFVFWVTGHGVSYKIPADLEEFGANCEPYAAHLADMADALRAERDEEREDAAFVREGLHIAEAAGTNLHAEIARLKAELGEVQGKFADCLDGIHEDDS